MDLYGARPHSAAVATHRGVTAMSLIRWDPFASVDDNFGRMLPGLFGRWPRNGMDTAGAPIDWRPSADISETDKEYLIRAELPAVRKDDVKVTVDGGMITIQGERKQEKVEKTEKYHRVESYSGHFERSFTLPENINQDAIRCESRDGLLTVHVPKTPVSPQTPKHIAVE
jgi:HSP20 family protein